MINLQHEATQGLLAGKPQSQLFAEHFSRGLQVLIPLFVTLSQDFLVAKKRVVLGARVSHGRRFRIVIERSLIRVEWIFRKKIVWCSEVSNSVLEGQGTRSAIHLRSLGLSIADGVNGDIASAERILACMERARRLLLQGAEEVTRWI